MKQYHFKSISNSAVILLCLCFLFSIKSVYCQVKPKTQAKAAPFAEYDKKIKIVMNKKIYFNDSLSVILRSYSHKMPMENGPTKATAYLIVSKDKLSQEITLSVHGVEGKSEKQDGLSNADRYENDRWKEYEFQLKAFKYDESVDVVVKRKKN